VAFWIRFAILFPDNSHGIEIKILEYNHSIFSSND